MLEQVLGHIRERRGDEEHGLAWKTERGFYNVKQSELESVNVTSKCFHCLVIFLNCSNILEGTISLS